MKNYVLVPIISFFFVDFFPKNKFDISINKIETVYLQALHEQTTFGSLARFK